MEPVSLSQPPTSRPRARRPASRLSRVGVTGVEKVIRIGAPTAAEQLFHAKLECFVDLGPQQKGVHMSRFEEVVNEAIDEVVLGERASAPRTLAAHIAERVRERQGGAARRGDDRGALPRAQARAGLAASRRRRSTRCSAPRSPPSAARAGSSASQAQGMTACPCAQELVAGQRPRAPRRRRLHRRRDRARSSRRSRSPPTTSAASARSTSAAPRAATPRSTRRDLLRIVEDSMSRGDLRADEALRRGAPSSRRPTAARASSRTACAR